MLPTPEAGAMPQGRVAEQRAEQRMARRQGGPRRLAAFHQGAQRIDALLLPEADGDAIQETLHLVAIPGMRESILEGLATPLEDLSEQPGW